MHHIAEQLCCRVQSSRVSDVCLCAKHMTPCWCNPECGIQLPRPDRLDRLKLTPAAPQFPAGFNSITRLPANDRANATLDLWIGCTARQGDDARQRHRGIVLTAKGILQLCQ